MAQVGKPISHTVHPVHPAITEGRILYKKDDPICVMHSVIIGFAYSTKFQEEIFN